MAGKFPCGHLNAGHNSMSYNAGHGTRGIRCRTCYNLMRKIWGRKRRALGK